MTQNPFSVFHYRVSLSKRKASLLRAFHLRFRINLFTKDKQCRLCLCFSQFHFNRTTTPFHCKFHVYYLCNIVLKILIFFQLDGVSIKMYRALWGSNLTPTWAQSALEVSTELSLSVGFWIN